MTMTPKTGTGIETEIKTRSGTEIRIGDIAQDPEIAGNVHVQEVGINDLDHGVERNIVARDQHQGKRSRQSHAGEKHPYIGMSHLQGLSIFHHFSIKPCKLLGKFLQTLLPTLRKQLYQLWAPLLPVKLGASMLEIYLLE